MPIVKAASDELSDQTVTRSALALLEKKVKEMRNPITSAH